MHLFIADVETVALGTDFLRIRCLATPLMFMSFFTVYLFQAFGEGNKALFLGIMRWGVFNIPMLFLLNTAFGMYGVVWSQITADILTVALSLYVYHRYKNPEKTKQHERKEVLSWSDKFLSHLSKRVSQKKPYRQG